MSSLSLILNPLNAEPFSENLVFTCLNSNFPENWLDLNAKFDTKFPPKTRRLFFEIQPARRAISAESKHVSLVTNILAIDS